MKDITSAGQVFVRLLLSISVFALIAPVSRAQTALDYHAVPPLVAESATPMVMLALSNDHQLFYKAFTDYDDLDGNGVIETTYEHSFDYVGYFDPYKCYEYQHVSSNTSQSNFKPVASTTTKYCNSTSGGNRWSGNFLNWATMARIDQIRKVLYGGMRDVDTLGQTILERTHLPNDAHSFAKYYNGTDLQRLTPFTLTSGAANDRDSGITICNTTHSDSSRASQNVTEKPLARVVRGNYSLWAANERFQCLYSEDRSKKVNTSYSGNGNVPSQTGIYAYDNNPGRSRRATQKNGTTIGDYVVRIQACVSTSLIGTEDCKRYPSGNLKPTGILQAFGDDSSMLWGLMSGSYRKNKSGGVLRKNIGVISDEINVDTDGTFKAAPATGGIINTINRFRIVNYHYHNGYYNDLDNCPWAMNSFNDGRCTNWGNPFAEILLECYRYFAGKQPNSAFDADDSTLLPGLTRQTTWRNPQNQSTACANLSVIAFNASSISYDGDQLSGVSDLGTSLSARALTNLVGDGEGIHGKSIFIGESGAATNQLCTPKTVNELGQVEGTCPDAPRLDGTYRMAGLAYHANIADLRPDIPDKQSVTTYGISLSPTLPKVDVLKDATRTVTILPACRNSLINGNCGLVDFKVVRQDATSGSFYVNWEDSEQGGDYDQDLSGLIEYELTNDNRLKITTRIIGVSTGDSIGFGFVVSGTTEDGFHALSGINGFSGFGCNNCRSNVGTKTFNLGTSNTELLEQPLYYAAKWGGFVDMDGDNKPLDPREYDTRDNSTGAAEPDGVPDNYFLAINPKQLKDQLTAILTNILNRTGAGTAASVVSNTGTGEGTIFQALFNPRYESASNYDYLRWVGTLNALFIDGFGNIREDNAEPFGRLTEADNIIRIFYDAVGEQTLVQRYAVNADGTRGDVVGSAVKVRDIKPIWSANAELSRVSSYVTQRGYGNFARNGRYIFTSIDVDRDGQIGSDTSVNETFAFTAATFNPSGDNSNYRLLGLNSATSGKAVDLVNYIRGAAIDGFRSRRIDVDGDGNLEPMLLGDIVNSSPLAVGRPSAGYDIMFNDQSYRDFREQYRNRRQMVYVGANDGMLHAFNGGFYNPATSGYTLKNTDEMEHPLGAELWAYIPYNLLPHLQWLAQPDYPHVFYMDGDVQSFDAQIFDDDDTHPGGWGTILVAGMRLGGGEYTLDPDNDMDGDSSNDLTLRSAYVVLDVTDPENAPTVLAEVSHPDLGYTTSKPTVIKNAGKWYLVFGSGPAGATDAGRKAALKSAVSEKTAKIFVYDFEERELHMHDLGYAASFVGGITAADWGRTFNDNAIYFGTVGGTITAPTGRLMRGELSTSGSDLDIEFEPILNVTNQAFSATPLAVLDTLGDRWLYSGTGRFMVSEDSLSNRVQTYYGVKESPGGSTVNKSDMVDTTDIAVFTDGTIRSRSNPGAPIRLPDPMNPGDQFTATLFDEVTAVVASLDGWYFDFERPRGRNTTETAISGKSLVFTEYQPSGLLCTPGGNGFLHARHPRTGLPGAFAALGTDSSSVNDNEAEEVLGDIPTGIGSPSAVGLHQLADGSAVGFVQTSMGGLEAQGIGSGIKARRQSWRELLIDWTK